MGQTWFAKLFGRYRGNATEKNQKACDDGDAQAQFDRGLSFTTGRGKAQDYEEAARWYLKAAGQDHAAAQFALGMMFAAGHGVPQDEVTALSWIRKAAQHGFPEAQHALGLRCRRASFKGAPADVLESTLEAYKWFRLASAQGYDESEAQYECVAIRMTHEQVIAGNRRVATFVSAS